MAIELKQHDHGGHSHTHDHDHAHDHGDENLENLFTIGICGSFSVVAIILGGMSVVMQRKGMLSYILAEPFHVWVLISGSVLLLLTAIRAIALWQTTGSHAHHDHDHGHVHDENCKHEPVKAASHDHSHDDHEHGGVFWRAIVLMFPVVLFFLGLPNQSFSAAGAERLLGKESAIGEVSEVADKQGGGRFDFAELSDSASDADKREALQGQTVTIKGQLRRVGDRQCTLYRLKMTCCAADTIPLKASIITDASLNSFKDHIWVEVTGKLQFVQMPGQLEFIPLIRAELKNIKSATAE